MSDQKKLAFLSHAGVDSERALALADRLERAARADGKELQVWIDKRDLVPGSPWQRQLDAALASSTGFVVYIGSRGVMNWVESEVHVALERAVQNKAYPLVPVLAADGRSEDLPGFLRQYQGVQNVEADDRAFTDLLRALLHPGASARVHRRAAERRPGARRPGVEERPFQGLSAFTAARSHLFKGRDAERDELVDRLRAEHLTMVVGDSGSGKSSLVAAGLVPAFRGGAFARRTDAAPDETVWHVVESRPLNDPFDQLATAVGKAAERVGRDAQTRELARRLIRGEVVDGERRLDPMRFRDGLREGAPLDARILVVVDQFEELLTLSPERDRQAFVDALMRAADPVDDEIRVVLTMRRDYFNLCSEFPDFFARLERNDRRAVYPLRRMRDAGLREAVVEPLRLAGVDEASRNALADAVLRDVGDRPGELALLEMALTKAWELHEKEGVELLAAYERIGRIEGALANAAEALFRTHNEATGQPLAKPGLSDDERRLAEVLFVRLVRLGDTGGATRRVAWRNELDDATWALAQKLARGEYDRLVVIGQPDAAALDGPVDAPVDGAGEAVELAHEALVSQWPRFQRWLQNREHDPRADDKRRLDRLIDRAKAWTAADRRARARTLATGAELEEYEGLLARRGSWLSDQERRFVVEGTEARRKASLLKGLMQGAVVLLAIVASYAGWAAWMRASELLLTAAERAVASGDRTHARGFLQEVPEPARQETWRRLAFALAGAAPLADWQAEERLLGESTPGYFVTVAGDGRVRQRSVHDPTESTEFRWPFRPDVGEGRGPKVFATPQRNLLLADFGQGTAVWETARGAEPVATGYRFEVDPRQRWFLLFSRDEPAARSAELRLLSDPGTVLSSIDATEAGILSGYVGWSDAGALVEGEHSRVWLLTPEGAEPLPFDPHFRWRDAAYLTAMPEIQLPSPAADGDSCPAERLRLRRIGGGWEPYAADGVDEWLICDPPALMLTADRAMSWAPGGLLVLEIAGDAVRQLLVPWERIPECECTLCFLEGCARSLAEGEAALLLSESRRPSPGQEAEPCPPSTPPAPRARWRVDLSTGEVSEAGPEAEAESLRDLRGRPLEVFWRRDGLVAARQEDEILLGADPGSERLAAVPWRLDLPWSHRDPPLLAFADRHVVAGYADEPLVRHWALPDPPADPGRRYRRAWWLRDGRKAVYDHRGPAIELEGEPPIRWRPSRWSPDRAVLAASGERLLLLSWFGGFVAFELGGEATTLTPLHPDLRSAGPTDLVLDPSGRRVAMADQKGLRLWSTEGLAEEGEVLAGEFPGSAIFSAGGNHLVTLLSGRVTLWDLEERRETAAVAAPTTIFPLAVDGGRQYLLQRSNAEGSYHLTELATGTTITLRPGLDIQRARFDPSSRYLAVANELTDLLVLDLANPGARELHYSSEEPFGDFRWTSEGGIELLRLDGSVTDLPLDSERLAAALGEPVCALPAARQRWLEEPPSDALAAYRDCLGP